MALAVIDSEGIPAPRYFGIIGMRERCPQSAVTVGIHSFVEISAGKADVALSDALQRSSQDVFHSLLGCVFRLFVFHQYEHASPISGISGHMKHEYMCRAAENVRQHFCRGTAGARM
jgi:hypothetical protein